MKHLNKPTFDVKSILLDCANSYRDSNSIKNKIIEQADYIKSKSEEYDELAKTGNWELFEKNDVVNNSLSKDDMQDIYKNKFAKQKKIKQKYYDKIMILADKGKCPICGISQVSNLDHYLAKSIYPTYSVTPINLIPVCRDCNFNKLDKDINHNSEAPLNPYYDDIDKIEWLKANIIFNDTIVVKYFVNNSLNDYDPLLFKRILNHFDIYKLNSTYSNQASSEIEESKWYWKKINNKTELISYFRELLTSYENIQVNTWRTALYRALIQNIEIIYQYLSI